MTNNFSISVTISEGLKKLGDPAQLEPAVQRGLQRGGLRLLAAIQASLTQYTKTGRTRSSFTLKMQGPYSAIVGSDSKTALFLEEGTRPHEIRPNRTRVLAWPVGGSTVAGLGRGQGGRSLRSTQATGFATVVQHPGTQPIHYLEDAVNSEKSAIIAAMESELKKLL